MPKMEPKEVQRELGQGLLWPFYWIYGSEKLKCRELIKRIRTRISEDSPTSSGLTEEVFEGTESTGHQILDAAHSLSLYPGIRLILVKEAHALKNPEVLTELMRPAQKISELDFICICIAKDLDGRKKFSKTLQERAAVVSCEEVPQTQRDAWIHYLAKNHQVEITPSMLMKLHTLEPWSLDIVNQELEKLSLSETSEDVLLENPDFFGGTDSFLDHFFSRSLSLSLAQVSFFADKADTSLPLLGLLGWNVRQLTLLISDRENKTAYAKLNPYHADRMRSWSAKWTLAEITQLQRNLSEIDFHLKQTPLLPLGLWTDLVTRFCF